jgi:hypothetical protein
MNVDLSPFKRFIELTREKNRLRDELKAVTTEWSEMARELPTALVDMGMPSMKLEVDGQAYTLFAKTTVRARAKDGDQQSLNAVLAEHGYADLIQERVNAQTLQALVNEYSRSEEGIPSWLASAVDTFDDTQLSARKA